MIYIQIVNNVVTGFTNEWKPNGNYESRHDWKTMIAAESRAVQLNFALGKLDEFIAIDNGAHVSPRFDIIRRPHVGDKISYAFNGDSYPDGTITKISGKNFKIVTTDTGSVYYRRKFSGGWVKKGGTWSMIKGHHDERNPSF